MNSGQCGLLWEVLDRIDRIKKRRCDMKSDIGKFRLLSRVAFAVMVVVAGLFVCHCGEKVS